MLVAMDDERAARLEARVQAIEERNARVERDKTWETSWARKLAILALTYIVIVLFMLVSRIENPWVNAVVPSVAFVISTATLPLIKKLFQK